MKIIKTKDKYINAILCGDKTVFITREYIEPYSTVKLISDKKEIQIITGDCQELIVWTIKNKWNSMIATKNKTWYDEDLKDLVSRGKTNIFQIKKIYLKGGE